MVEKIREYQDEMEDKVLDKWIDDIMKNKVGVMDNSNINKILPEIMGDLMNKLEHMEEKVVKYRKAIYENIEENKINEINDLNRYIYIKNNEKGYR